MRLGGRHVIDYNIARALQRKRFVARRKAPDTFHHGDLREALVEAAAHAVERDGHPQLSLRPLALQLGVSQPAVYRHFPSKEALLGEVANRGWMRLQSVLEQAPSGHDDPHDGVRAIGRTYVRWAMEHPHLFRLLSSRVPAEQRERPHPALPREHYHRGLARAVPIDDPRLADAFRAMWAVAHGLAVLVVEQVFALVNTDDERLAAADAAIDCFVEMLAARWPA